MQFILDTYTAPLQETTTQRRMNMYIAPLQDPYSEALPTQAKWKRTVFRSWWNRLGGTLDLRKANIKTNVSCDYVPVIMKELVPSLNIATSTFIHSFIHSGYLYSTPLRNLLRGALSPATAKEKCLKKLAQRRHVPGQEVQCKREFITSGGPITEKARCCFLTII